MQAERVVIDIHSRISALSILYIAVNEREYPPKVPNASLLGYAVSTNPCMADLCFFFCHEFISCLRELLLHNVTQIGQVIEPFLQRIVDSRALLHHSISSPNNSSLARSMGVKEQHTIGLNPNIHFRFTRVWYRVSAELDLGTVCNCNQPSIFRLEGTTDLHC